MHKTINRRRTNENLTRHNEAIIHTNTDTATNQRSRQPGGKQMNENDFIQDRSRVIDSLSNIQNTSSSNYNKAQESISNNLFTAATAYIAIILAFTSNIQSKSPEHSWIIFASIISFSSSLIPWVIEKAIASSVHGKTISLSSKLSTIAINDVRNNDELIALDRIAAKLLCGGKTSLIPIILQIFLFSLGVLFAVIAIAITLL